MAAVRKTLFFSVLLLSFIFIASVTRVDGALCQRPSRLFRGLCFRSSNCASVCHGEHFADGYCHGLRRRCICRKPC
ncbi:Defensin-like protein 5 [Cinnamomum micranthum f. kanehirae]|uniref:Defensin-like protein 5 n=1 Tax=Cinnamomum micranthum f. kanehirae TaxID=337451 RepID=A0A3S3PKU2_9MAGN|nr:Defensin-like protein 5 [Cinnamomum micranthum f. kanehirae]